MSERIPCVHIKLGKEGLVDDLFGLIQNVKRKDVWAEYLLIHGANQIFDNRLIEWHPTHHEIVLVIRVILPIVEYPIDKVAPMFGRFTSRWHDEVFSVCRRKVVGSCKDQVSINRQIVFRQVGYQHGNQEFAELLQVPSHSRNLHKFVASLELSRSTSMKTGVFVLNSLTFFA